MATYELLENTLLANLVISASTWANLLRCQSTTFNSASSLFCNRYEALHTCACMSLCIKIGAQS